MKSKGFTLVEILIVLAIMGILFSITTASFVSFRNAQALDKDTETVVEVMRQARTQTLTSQNASSYGVHFASTTVTMFAGTTFSASDPANRSFPINGSDTILTLTGSASDVVFNRLSGETSQNGTITMSSKLSGRTKTITIYKTGLIEYQ